MPLTRLLAASAVLTVLALPSPAQAAGSPGVPAPPAPASGGVTDRPALGEGWGPGGVTVAGKSMSTGGVPLTPAPAGLAPAVKPPPASPGGLPDNYGLASS